MRGRIQYSSNRDGESRKDGERDGWGGGGRRNFLNGKDQKERGLEYSKEDHWISLGKVIVKRKFEICGRRDESDERVGIYFYWLTQRGLST
jgi:hypothetical protein